MQRSKLRLFSAVLAGLPFTTLNADAALFTWNGSAGIGAGSNNWSNAQNWVNQAVPPNDATATVRINSSSRPNPVVDQPWNILFLEFFGTSNYALSGQPLTVGVSVNHNGDGTATINNSLVVGASINSSAALIINGPLLANPSTNGLALSGSSLISLTGTATNTFAGQISVSTGTLLLAKPAGVTNVIGNLNVGNSTGAPGDAMVRLDSDEQIAHSASGNVTINQSGVFDLNGRAESLNNFSLRGALTSSGGTLTVNTLNMLGGSINLAGGTLICGQSVLVNNLTNTAVINSGSLRLGVGSTMFNVNNFAIDVELDIPCPILDNPAGASTLRKELPGLLNLRGASSYSGGTTVAAGVLRVDNGGGSATGTGSVTVQSGARIEGGGQIAGQVIVNSNATIAPGAAVGDLSIGALQLNAGARTEIELAGPIRAAQHDAFNINSAAALNGTLTLARVGGYVPDHYVTHNILHSFGTRTGNFAQVNGVSLAADKSLAVTYDADDVFVTAALPGDANLDRRVDIADFAVLASQFNSPGTWAHGDFTGDGLTNINDFALLAGHFNMSIARDLPRTALPDPSVISPMTLACALLPRARRRIGT